MTMNKEAHGMHAQMLNLRSAGIACATAVHYFPHCVRKAEDYDRQCQEAKASLQPIYEDMKDLLLSVRMVLAAVFNASPDAWDLLWELNEDSNCIESDMAKFGETFYSDQDEYIRSWAEIDNDMMDQLGTSFRDEEWKVISAKEAWQNGPRLPQVLRLLKYLEDQIAKRFDSVLYSGLLGDCHLGKHYQKKKAANA